MSVVHRASGLRWGGGGPHPHPHPTLTPPPSTRARNTSTTPMHLLQISPTKVLVMIGREERKGRSSGRMGEGRREGGGGKRRFQVMSSGMRIKINKTREVIFISNNKFISRLFLLLTSPFNLAPLFTQAALPPPHFQTHSSKTGAIV